MSDESGSESVAAVSGVRPLSEIPGDTLMMDANGVYEASVAAVEAAQLTDEQREAFFDSLRSGVSGRIEELHEAVAALDSGVVHLSGNETIAGVKTFTSGIVTPSVSVPSGTSTLILPATVYLGQQESGCLAATTFDLCGLDGGDVFAAMGFVHDALQHGGYCGYAAIVERSESGLNALNDYCGVLGGVLDSLISSVSGSSDVEAVFDALLERLSAAIGGGSGGGSGGSGWSCDLSGLCEALSGMESGLTVIENNVTAAKNLFQTVSGLISGADDILETIGHPRVEIASDTFVDAFKDLVYKSGSGT